VGVKRDDQELDSDRERERAREQPEDDADRADVSRKKTT
jgi:hypothetical protein